MYKSWPNTRHGAASSATMAFDKFRAITKLFGLSDRKLWHCTDCFASAYNEAIKQTVR